VLLPSHGKTMSARINTKNPHTPEAFNELAEGSLIGLMGVEITEVSAGRLRARMTIRADHLAPNDFLHAASVVALADSACGFATLAHLPDGAETFTTIELKSNFLGTATEGEVLCEAVAQHAGRTTQVWDATVKSAESDRTIALFRCTQMVLWPK